MIIGQQAWKMNDTWTDMMDGEEVTLCRYERLKANKDVIQEVLRSIETLEADVKKDSVENIPQSFLIASMEKAQ